MNEIDTKLKELDKSMSKVDMQLGGLMMLNAVFEVLTDKEEIINKLKEIEKSFNKKLKDKK